jgi:hypothetical protein
MKTLVAVLSLTLLTGAATRAAADPDLSKLPPPSDKKGLTYQKDIRPLFAASCLRCHGEQRPKGGLRLDNLAAALKGGKDGAVITPGKSQESKLVIAASQIDDESAMPPKRGPGGGGGGGAPGGGGRRPGGAGGPGGPGGGGNAPKPLTPEQVGLIRAWIDQGAK